MRIQMPEVHRLNPQRCRPLAKHCAVTRKRLRRVLPTVLSNLATEVDSALAKPEKEALKALRQLRDSGRLVGFGNGRQVPKRIFTLAEMRLNKIEPTALLSPTDETVNGVSRIAQGSALAGIIAAYIGFDLVPDQLLTGLVPLTIAYFTDQVVYGGGVRALALDTLARLINGEYSQRVAMHEAGHFMVAYLLGTAPKEFTLTAVDAWKRYKAFNVQAGTLFLDEEFQAEVATGRLSSSSLDQFACIALAGVATEYIKFGTAEGGMGDIAQLDAMLKGLQFSQKKADGEVRWAVLNSVALLRQHAAAHEALSAAMQRGDSVGSCVQILEEALNKDDLLKTAS